MPQADGSLLFDSKLDLAGFQVGVDLVSNAIQGIGAKLKDLATSVLTTGMTFESSMSEVQALSGAMGAELEALTETAKEYGASTKYTAAESAQAFKYMALAGWDAQQMTVALPGVLSLAASAGMELAEASDIVTDYLSAFGMEASEATYLADLLSYAQANSNTTVEQLSGAYKNCAANMHSAGQTVETTTALLAMMANQGFKGEEAGTALSATMRDLSDKMYLVDDTLVKGNEELKGQEGYIENLSDLYGQYVVDIGNTAVAVSDANGNYRQLTDILEDLEQATNGMSEAEQTAALQNTLTVYSIKGVNMMLNAGAQSAQDFAAELENSAGTAADAAATMQDNIEGDLASLSSAFEGLQLNVFEEMKEPIRDVLQTLTKTLQDGKTQKAASDLGKVLADMARTLAEHLPDVIEAVSKIVKLLWENKGLIAGIGAAVAAGKAISSVTTGVKLFATDISSVVKTVKSLGDTKKTLSGLDSVLKGIGGLGTFTAVIGGLATIKKVHEETTRKMYDDIYEVSDAVKEATENATQNIEAFHESMQQNHTELLDADAELENIQALKQRLEELVGDNGTVKVGYEEEVAGILDQINAYAGTSYEVLDGVITKNGEVITNFQEASAELDTLIEKQHAQAVLSAFEEDYIQAIQERTEKTEALAEARRDYNDALLDYNIKKAENDQANAMHMNAPWSEVEMKESAANVEEHAESIRTLTQDLKNCTTTISNYEAALKAVQNGDYTGLEALRQMAETPIQTAETAASLEELKTQYQDYLSIYEEMQRMQEEGFDIDESTMLATKEKVTASLIELGKASGLEGGLVTGQQFMQALQDSTLSQGEKIEAIKAFLGGNLDMTEIAQLLGANTSEILCIEMADGMERNLWSPVAAMSNLMSEIENTSDPFELGRSLGADLMSGLEWGINGNLWSPVVAMSNAINAVNKSGRKAADSNSPSKKTIALGEDIDRGLEIGIANRISNISAVADTAVSSALGIMNIQGASAVAPYNPVFTQAYSVPQAGTPTATPANNTPQNGGDIIIPISIGDETIETVVVNAVTRANASSGGWSV